MGVNQDEDSPDKLVGATDGTEIGNVGDRLKVDSILTGGSAGASGCPVFSPKYRVRFGFSDISIPGAGATIFTYTGSGKLSFFNLRFDDKKIEVTLDIDGTSVIDAIELEDLEKFGSKEELPGMPIRSGKGDKEIIFDPKCPIEFLTSVTLSAAATGGTKKLKGFVVCLTEET